MLRPRASLPSSCPLVLAVTVGWELGAQGSCDKPGMEQSELRVAWQVAAGAPGRRPASCLCVREMAVGVEGWGGLGLSWFPVLFSFIITTHTSLSSVCATHPHALCLHTCAHMGTFYLFLSGWHLSPRHRCLDISVASRLAAGLCSKSASGGQGGCSAASYPSQEGQKPLLAKTVQSHPFPSTVMVPAFLSPTQPSTPASLPTHLNPPSPCFPQHPDGCWKAAKFI